MRLVAVTGGKGGPGATTLAVGLAGAWAAAGQSVLLVDLDPAGGDVAAHLPVADVRRGVAPLLGSPGVPPGPAAVLAEVAQVNQRLGLLAGLARPDAAGLVRAGDRVAVVASGTPDQPDVRAGVVLSSVPVLSVLTPPTDGGGEGRLLVSVAVTLEEAPLLARAAQGTIDLVLLPRVGDG